MLLLHYMLKNISFFTTLVLLVSIIIEDNFDISPISIISKLIFSIMFFLLFEWFIDKLYTSYKIVTVNKITHMINAKWFFEKDLTEVTDLFENDFRAIILTNKKLYTYTHTSFARKLIEFIVGVESATKFRKDKLSNQKLVYEKNGNIVILKKDKIKINRNIIGEFSFLI